MSDGVLEQIQKMEREISLSAASVRAKLDFDLLSKLEFFRQDALYAPSVLALDQFAMLGTRATAAALDPATPNQEKPKPIDEPTVKPSAEPEVAQVEATPAEAEETKRAVAAPDLTIARLAVLADGLALLCQVVGVSPYFLKIWVETVTSPQSSEGDLKEAASAFAAVLSAAVGDDAEDEGGTQDA